ncbi:AraC family transcriptional regulator [Anaerocolumna sp. AGMB13020]|uniref:AraC family transcriptional regulator n=1 Tax=Anaerocolumna sp. AGMB13020 TaxID=3081750 RepID=UPI0029554EF0|nr:AraC family transcriptional regulator [Anaerocolumna sp. AGMB13020]WOO36438.1 AraC family transcriptional regulator [Anaerocolumna sp. AGMB13020]
MQKLGYNESKQRGTFDFPIEFYHVDPNHPQYIMSYHWHMEYEIIRILEGCFVVTLDEREHLAKKGDILFLNSGTLHGGTPTDCIYQCVVFDMNMLVKKENACNRYIKEIMNHTYLINEYYPAAPIDNNNIHSENPNSLQNMNSLQKLNSLQNINFTEQLLLKQHLNCLFDTLKEKALGCELITQGLLYLILGSITKNHYYSTDSETQRNHKRIHLMKQVLELMEESYQNSLTLEQLSKAAGMSPKYFCRFFQEMTHKSPFEYLNNYRIERACCQLLSSEDSITEIAYACGFNDLSYFIKLFKRFKGITPAKYRKLFFLPFS